MKASIKADGTLIVYPESETEAYALKQWGSASFELREQAELDRFPKMIVDCGSYPGAFVTSTRRLPT